MTAHILVVDDEAAIADVLAKYLRQRTGYVVTVSGSGEEAMSTLISAPKSPAGAIDLVILDMRMPVVSGLQILDWLRRHPILQYTRVVMLTATTGSQPKVDALSAGADDYITKPYHPQELLARVQTILRTQQLEKQLQKQSQQLAALNRATNAITTTLDVRQIPAAAVAGARAVLGVELAAIFLHDKTQTQLLCQAVNSRPSRLNASDYPTIAVGEGVVGLAYAERTRLILNTPQGDYRFRPGKDTPPGLSANNLMVMPLMVRNRPVGVLTVLNKSEGAFSDVDSDLFASLGGAIGRGLENAWLFQSVKSRQQELQDSHGRLQAVMNGILDPIYTINDAWQLVAVNRRKADDLAVSSDQLIGQRCYQVLYQRDTPCDHCRAVETLTLGVAERWSVRWTGEDHLPQEWRVHAYPVPAVVGESTRAVIVWQDRTEERRLENSLLQAGKLAAIGQLAAGVAHEINNPLTAINANAEMLKMFIRPDDENYESVDLIARAGGRATAVVRDLLDFARQNRYSFVPGKVNDSIESALTLVSYQLQSAQLEIEPELADDLPYISASWEHLKTVWLNLIINARDAVLSQPNQDGYVKIVTRLAPAGTHIQVLVNDNGIGMTPAEMAHIFEPFYTTKDPGKGTGLGLATCQRIIQQHGGHIEVTSEPHKGTTFIVHLALKAWSDGQDGYE